MREHALPQDVTGYRFHIIGNMTLKQFAEVAVGCVIGFLLYQSNLYPIIKFPLVILAAGGGAMIAFVPLEERPLDQWITAFFRALYRPTQYYWKRTPKIPEPFLYEPRSEMKTVVADVDLTPARRQRVKEYLNSIDKDSGQADQLEAYTEQRLADVMSVFGTQQSPALAYTNDQVAEPHPDEVEALLNASPDTVSSTVDNLSFAGRAATEEPVIETGPSNAEVEMSNNVLRLFDADTTQPAIDTVPTFGNDFAPPPEFAPLPPAPTPPPVEPPPETVPAAVDVSIAHPIDVPQPEPVVQPTVIPDVDLSPAPPTETLNLPPQPQPLPADLSSIPDVSLEPTASEPAPAELPQITTVFDSVAEPISVPAVQTVPKYQLKPESVSADNASVANVADVIAYNATAGDNHRSRSKNKVSFKTNRTAKSDKYETVLPHIIDMAGESSTVEVEPPPPAITEPQNVNLPKEVVVPEVEEIRIKRTVEEPKPTVANESVSEVSSAVDPSLLQMPEKQQPVQATSAVTFNKDLPFPDKPTKPNKVVGMVIDQAGTPQANAIVEILTPAGIPARAVKTNPLGQFFIATPLNPGDYMITAEKEGLKFSTHQLAVTNKIIDPIEIRAS